MLHLSAPTACPYTLHPSAHHRAPGWVGGGMHACRRMLWLIRDCSEDALSLYLQCTNADWLVPVEGLVGAEAAPTAAVGDGATSKGGTCELSSGGNINASA